MDMPELDLPMYKSPHRVVHALLESAEDLEQMKMKKMFEGELEEPRVDYYKMSPFGNMKARMDSGNKYEMMEQMMKTFMNHKNKRAADDVFELGDRLTEKLKQETVKMQAKLGNASCVLQE